MFRQRGSLSPVIVNSTIEEHYWTDSTIRKPIPLVNEEQPRVGIRVVALASSRCLSFCRHSPLLILAPVRTFPQI